MTLYEALTELISKHTYNIGFIGIDGESETQFDVNNLSELEELWEDFCHENGLPLDCVEYVELDELEE